GEEIVREAEAQGVRVAFEASVGGGIPILRTLKEGLAGDRTVAVYGIVNGTCNHILTTMTREGRSFADVLAEAQRLGLAEADPSTDIDGVDSAHKLALLTTLAFGVVPRFERIPREGIRRIDAVDIALAREPGSTIHLPAHPRHAPPRATGRWAPGCACRPGACPSGRSAASPSARSRTWRASTTCASWRSIGRACWPASPASSAGATSRSPRCSSASGAPAPRCRS